METTLEQAQQADFRVETIGRIMECGLTAAEKVVVTRLYLYAWQHEPEAIPDSTEFRCDVVILPGMSGKRLAALAGAHEGTASGAITKLHTFKVLKREIDRYAVNRDGNPIPPQSMDTRRGDHWESTTTLTLPMIPPIERLPAKPNGQTATPVPTPKQERDRETARELRNVIKHLRETRCPECGQTGEWHLMCGACGATWHTDDMIDDDDTPKIPEIPVICDSQITGISQENANFPEPGISVSSSSEGRENRVTGTGITEAGALMDTPLSVSDPHQAGADDELAGDYADFDPTMTGSATVEYLSDLDVSLTSVYRPGAIMPNGDPSDGKQPIPPVDELGYPTGSWVDHPVPLPDVLVNLEHQGNAGMLPERGNWYVLDIDDGTLDALVTAYPELALCGRFWRDNAPGLGKLLFQLEESGIRKQTYQGNGRKVEFLGAGSHAVVAGTHKTGRPICFTPFPDRIPVFKFAQIDAWFKQWTATPDKPRGDFRTSAALAASTVKPASDLLRTTYQWFDTNAAFLAEVRRLLDRCPHKGQYVAIRPDDGTPSTRECHDSYSQTVKPTWRDYGSGETIDAVELYCRLTGTDKRTYQWQLVNEYRAAHGQPALRSNR
ncbi:MAG: hypothetical protein M5U05_19590 [Anaerolineales bacterium]|nr:hypothetical protein [Anaerolineales bacterium]